ncbi:MAG: hypothetical protein U9Q82_06035, partial [Chloroflexota bacterium]|nr:hypothetical protein [Chloroflexota bacterium]
PTIDISNFETPEKSNASVDIAKTVVTKTVDIEAQGRQLPTETATSTQQMSIPIMPFITGDHQGFTYGPGQQVTVIVEGFEPGVALSVELKHEEYGLIDVFTKTADERGKIPIYHTIDGSYPDGDFTYHVTSSNGLEKEYKFSLDHSHVVESVPFEGCGIYPEPALGSVSIVWCTGYALVDAPIEVSGSVNGNELFHGDDETAVWDDTVVTYVLGFAEEDPVGEWSLEIGDRKTFSFELGKE